VTFSKYFRRRSRVLLRNSLSIGRAGVSSRHHHRPHCLQKYILLLYTVTTSVPDSAPKDSWPEARRLGGSNWCTNKVRALQIATTLNHCAMVEVQSQTTSPKPAVIKRCTEVPMAVGSPTASEMRRRRRRHSRLMSNASSVVSAAAAGIPASEKHKISWVHHIIIIIIITMRYSVRICVYVC
jgi:hypothetical protein